MAAAGGRGPICTIGAFFDRPIGEASEDEPTAAATTMHRSQSARSSYQPILTTDLNRTGPASKPQLSSYLEAEYGRTLASEQQHQPAAVDCGPHLVDARTPYRAAPLVERGPTAKNSKQAARLRPSLAKGRGARSEPK